MTWRCLSCGTERTYALVCAKGEDPLVELLACAQRERLGASRFTAIGALSSATLGYFDKDAKEYLRIPVDEQLEVLSLIGDITLKPDGRPNIHAHAVLGGRDGCTKGGHLMAATVDPTLEVIISESPAHLRRRHDPSSGLDLIDLDLQ